jgi:hypothetical protein
VRPLRTSACRAGSAIKLSSKHPFVRRTKARGIGLGVESMDATRSLSKLARSCRDVGLGRRRTRQTSCRASFGDKLKEFWRSAQYENWAPKSARAWRLRQYPAESSSAQQKKGEECVVRSVWPFGVCTQLLPLQAVPVDEFISSSRRHAESSWWSVNVERGRRCSP